MTGIPNRPNRERIETNTRRLRNDVYVKKEGKRDGEKNNDVDVPFQVNEKKEQKEEREREREKERGEDKRDGECVARTREGEWRGTTRR